MKRRQLLLGSGSVLAAGLLGMQQFAGQSATSGLLLSAYTTSEGKHFIAGVGRNGEDVFALEVPWRAHDSLALPGNQQALFFARRPGTRAYVVDLNRGTLQHTITSAPNRHFYGHGCVSVDGRHLFTTENNIDNSSGCIGIYDIRSGFKRLGEWHSHGIGPHQLALLNDGRTLAVANGGIQTHPERGRDKLNLDTMQPSLAYVDSESGTLIDAFLPPHHQQSIRHLAVAPDDSVVVAVQFQGDPDTLLPLAYQHAGEQQLQPLAEDEMIWQRHQQYTGSVCISDDGHRALLSSPRGGIVSAWDLRERKLLSIIKQRDGAGVAFDPNSREFALSNGQGQITSVGAADLMQNRQHSHYFAGRRWDNHMNYVSENHSSQNHSSQT